MRRLGLAVALSLLIGGTASAQSWVPWNQPNLIFERPKSKREAAPGPAGPATKQTPGRAAGAPPTRTTRPVRAAAAVALEPAPRPEPKPAPKFLDGGARPEISPASPSSVSINTGYGAGTIVIDNATRRLYLMQSNTTALSYPVTVGREGFRWKGTETISRVASWPDWRPPAEMRQREPQLPEVMSGGVRNPLGAKALYLGNSLYRIHGTNSQSVGGASSSGCFRMNNSHVVDLATRVGPGTKVIVK